MSTSPGRLEAVVRVVVVALADLPQQNRAGALFHGEVVVQPLLDVDALAGGEAHPRSRRDNVGTAIGVDGDVGLVNVETTHSHSAKLCRRVIISVMIGCYVKTHFLQSFTQCCRVVCHITIRRNLDRTLNSIR